MVRLGSSATLALALLIGACSPLPAQPAPVEWTYERQKDEMRGITITTATLPSDQLKGGEPPTNEPYALLVVTDGAPQGDGAWIIGQFGMVCTWQQVRIKIDDGPIEQVPCDANDDLANRINLGSYLALRLKTAQKVFVETGRIGNAAQFSFTTAGLSLTGSEAAS